MSDIPAELHYTKEHEWVSAAGSVATIGITDYAQGELGDIIFLELPEPGTHVGKGDPFGTVEAVKTVEEIYAPVTGEILEINGELEEHPEQVNQAPYHDGWLVRIKMSDPSELEQLLDSEAYREQVGD